MIRRTVLQLNQSFEPLRIVTPRHALKLITKGKARVVVPTSIEIYPGVFLPSVIRLLSYAHVPYKRPVPSRKNIFNRDGNRCMYCGRRASNRHNVILELEHIVPRSKNGPNSWDNLVASCHECNQKKRDRTPEEAGMTLIHRPLPATIHTSRFVLQQVGAEIEDWTPYLWKDSKGDQKLQFA